MGSDRNQGDPTDDVRAVAEQRAADRFHGAIARELAINAGMTRAQIDRRVRSGQWIPLGPRGWYAPVGQASDPLPRLVAAVAAYDGPAWGASALAMNQLGNHPPLPMVATHRRCSSRPGAEVIYVAGLGELPQTTIDGVRSVTTAVAVVSAGRWLATDTDLHLLVDEAIRSGRTTWREIEAVLRLFPARGRGGSTRMRQVLDDHAIDPALPLSNWGREFVVGLCSCGLPRPRMEHRVSDQTGRLVAQVDAAYPKLRYAIELDSHAHHLNPEAFERDRRRDGDLAQLGWLVRRFTWEQWHRQRSWVVATIRADLRTRQATTSA